MMSNEKLATRGFLSARHLADIRKVAKIARSTGITLTVHNVTINGNQDSSRPVLPVHDGRAASSTKLVNDRSMMTNKSNLTLVLLLISRVKAAPTGSHSYGCTITTRGA